MSEVMAPESFSAPTATSATFATSATKARGVAVINCSGPRVRGPSPCQNSPKDTTPHAEEIIPEAKGSCPVRPASPSSDH